MTRNLQGGLARFWLVFGATILAFLVGDFLGPVVYPYKLFSGESYSTILSLQVEAVRERGVSVDPTSRLLCGFLFAISYFAIRLRSAPLSAMWGMLLGIFLNIAFSGNQVVEIYLTEQGILGFPPEAHLATLIGHYLLYSMVMLGVPLAVSFGMSRFELAAVRRRTMAAG